MANSKIYIPKLSGIKAVPLNYFSNCGNVSENISPNQRSNDNTLLRNSITANENNYVNYQSGINFQPEGGVPMLSCDTMPIQLKSNFIHEIGHTIKVFENCNEADTEELETIQMSLIKDNQNYTIKYECKILWLSGWMSMYIYFTEGIIYDADNYEIGSFALNGDLPEFAEQIDSITLTGCAFNGTYDVLETVYAGSVNAYAFRVLVDANTGSDNSGRCQMTYQRDTFNVFQANIDLAAYENMDIRLQIKATYLDPEAPPGTETFTSTATIWTEPILVRKILSGYAKFEWYNENPHEVFLTDFENFRPFAYVQCQNWVRVTDSIEDETYETDTGSLRLIESRYKEVYNFIADMQISWRADLLDLIFKCDRVFIRGQQFRKLGKLESSQVESTDRLMLECLIEKVNANGALAEDFDFSNQELSDDASKLLIDANDYLKIDSFGNKLKI